MDQAGQDKPLRRLLQAGDPAPVAIDNPGGLGPFLLLGDHAGRAIPARLNALGLPPEALERHIAYDIGSWGLGRRLAELLNSPFVHQAYSRLVIDCNRRPGDPGSIAAVSDMTAVPENNALDDDAKAARRQEIFEPYHQAIASRIDASLATGRRPILVAVHSFTPQMHGADLRPWRFGVVHDQGSPFSLAVLAQLRARFGEAFVGDNQPYGMDGVDFTIPHHAIARGLDYLELETRQDLIANPEDQARVAEELAPLLSAALASL